MTVLARIWVAALAAGLAGGVTACGPQTPEKARSAAIAKCERQFGRAAPDPSKGNAMCTCMVDELAARGLEITDMLGGDREQVMQVGRTCAARSGVQLPG